MVYEQVWTDWQELTLVIMQLSSIFLTVQTIIRFKFYLDLLKMRQKIRDIEGIFSAGYGQTMLFEILFGLMHPNFFLHGRNIPFLR